MGFPTTVDAFDSRETNEGAIQPSRVTALQTAVTAVETALVGLTATPAQLNLVAASSGAIAALAAAGLGKSAAYVKTDAGVKTFLTGTAGDKIVVVVVHVDETFANGNTSQTTVQIGQVATAAKFADTTAFTGKTAGTVLVFAGTLTANTNLIVTMVAAAGTGTGGITVSVLLLPATA